MKNNKLKYKIASGVTLLLVGTLVLFSNGIKEKRDVVFSEMNLALSLELNQNEIEEEKVETTKEEPVKEEKQQETYNYEEYLGIRLCV